MADTIDKPANPEVVCSLPLVVRTGLADDRTIELDLGRSLTAILEIVATERGCAVEELVLIREGEGEPLTEAILLDLDYPHRRRHHVHHAGLVEVTVYYQADSHHRSFKRHQTIEDVLTWAIKTFNIDPSMATEFELALHDQTAELAGNEHIGHLAGRQCELALDLIRGHISNG